MPRVKTVFECVYNYCGERFDTVGDCEAHEVVCSQNPATHMCPTCKWEDWHSEYIQCRTYYMVDHRCDHPNANWECDVDTPNCSHWELKTEREWLYLEARKKDSRGFLSDWDVERIDKYIARKAMEEMKCNTEP